MIGFLYRKRYMLGVDIQEIENKKLYMTELIEI